MVRRHHRQSSAPRPSRILQQIRTNRPLYVSNSLSGRDWELDKAPAVGHPTHIIQIGTGYRVSTGEGQRRVALQCRVAACRIVVGLEVGKLSVQDHGRSRTAHGREILAALSRSGALRMGVTGAHEARS
jgi:hypothetical protein